MNNRILIVIDDLALRWRVSSAITSLGLDAFESDSLDSAIEPMRRQPPALLIIDIAPHSAASGIDSILEFRARATRALPIILLMPGGDESRRIASLAAGVDDYVVKPFATAELMARVRTVLRSFDATGAECRDTGGAELNVGGLMIDLAAQRVLCGDAVIALARQELRLLHIMMTQAERVFSRTQLVIQLWGQGAEVEERTIDVQIRRLRKALEPFSLDAMVQTVRGSGYRFSTRV